MATNCRIGGGICMWNPWREACGLRTPPNSGTMYHNYKGFFNVVILALVDATYKFLWIDCGGLGSMSDAQIVNESELKDCLEDGSIGFPQPDPLPIYDQPTPYFILVDGVFGGLAREQRIYNLQRSSRCGNAFGILSNLCWTSSSVVCASTAGCVSATLHSRMQYLIKKMIKNLLPGHLKENANMHDIFQVAGSNRDTSWEESKKATETVCHDMIMWTGAVICARLTVNVMRMAQKPPFMVKALKAELQSFASRLIHQQRSLSASETRRKRSRNAPRA